MRRTSLAAGLAFVLSTGCGVLYPDFDDILFDGGATDDAGATPGDGGAPDDSGPAADAGVDAGPDGGDVVDAGGDAGAADDAGGDGGPPDDAGLDVDWRWLGPPPGSGEPITALAQGADGTVYAVDLDANVYRSEPTDGGRTNFASYTSCPADHYQHLDVADDGSLLLGGDPWLCVIPGPSLPGAGDCQCLDRGQAIGVRWPAIFIDIGEVLAQEPSFSDGGVVDTALARYAIGDGGVLSRVDTLPLDSGPVSGDLGALQKGADWAALLTLRDGRTLAVSGPTLTVDGEAAAPVAAAHEWYGAVTPALVDVGAITLAGGGGDFPTWSSSSASPEAAPAGFAQSSLDGLVATSDQPRDGHASSAGTTFVGDRGLVLHQPPGRAVTTVPQGVGRGGAVNLFVEGESGARWAVGDEMVAWWPAGGAADAAPSDHALLPGLVQRAGSAIELEADVLLVGVDGEGLFVVDGRGGSLAVSGPTPGTTGANFWALGLMGSGGVRPVIAVARDGTFWHHRWNGTALSLQSSSIGQTSLTPRAGTWLAPALDPSSDSNALLFWLAARDNLTTPVGNTDTLRIDRCVVSTPATSPVAVCTEAGSTVTVDDGSIGWISLWPNSGHLVILTYGGVARWAIDAVNRTLQTSPQRVDLSGVAPAISGDFVGAVQTGDSCLYVMDGIDRVGVVINAQGYAGALPLGPELMPTAAHLIDDDYILLGGWGGHLGLLERTAGSATGVNACLDDVVSGPALFGPARTTADLTAVVTTDEGIFIGDNVGRVWLAPAPR
jgi:hypothetical protein